MNSLLCLWQLKVSTIDSLFAKTHSSSLPETQVHVQLNLNHSMTRVSHGYTLLLVVKQL